MKVLWITNMAIGKLSEVIYGKESNGLWIDALLKEFQTHNEHEIIIATVGKTKVTKTVKDGKTTYYLVPNADRAHYNPNKESNQKAWLHIINQEKPDLIQIWGTEFKHGLCAQLALERYYLGKKIPTLIYIQGILNEISYYYFAGMSPKDIIINTTIRDLIMMDTIFAQKRSYEKRSIAEAKMLNMSDGVIVENEWCKTHIHSISRNVTFNELPLSINQIFAENKWALHTTGEINLICNATGYPLKGLHMLIKALAIVKEKHPNIILNIPGRNLGSYSKSMLLFGTTYSVYINRLIHKYRLENNVHWLGTLPQRQLVDHMIKCNLFILCSALENHSSSLKEAMLLGMPCIASAVGGVPEYVSDGNNALLYRFEDYRQLAGSICHLLSDTSLMQHLSSEARNQMAVLHDGDSEYSKISKIYQRYTASLK